MASLFSREAFEERIKRYKESRSYTSEWLTEELGCFDDCEKYIDDKQFFTKFMYPCCTLHCYFQDRFDFCESECPEAMANMETEYKTHSGTWTEFVSYLEDKSNNPLMIAMNQDELKTSTNFKIWKDKVDYMMVRWLEINYLGIPREPRSEYLKKFAELELIRDKAQTLSHEMEKWMDGVKNNPSYWAELKKYVEKFQDDNCEMTLKNKADEIKTFLDTILIDDAFYLFVFDTPRKNMLFQCHSTAADQLLESYEREGCSIVIYRSKCANREDVKCSDAANVGLVCTFAGANVEMRWANFRPREGQTEPGSSRITVNESNGTATGFVHGCM